MTESHYDILGVQKTASPEEIKKAYRSLAKQHHPDRGGDAELFKKIALAYETLSDKSKKEKYDMELQYGSSSNRGGGFGNGGFGDFNFNFNPFEGFFQNIKKQQERAYQERSSKGEDLRITLNLTIFDIALGVNKKVKLTRRTKCGSCSGNGSKNGTELLSCVRCNGKGRVVEIVMTPIGHMHQESPCNSCGGSGKTIKEKCKNCNGDGLLHVEEVIDLNIPKGAMPGMVFKLDNMGNESRVNGKNGDLIVNVNEIKDEKFHRDNNDIYSDFYISLPDALLGSDNIEVDTVHGKVKIKIDPGTENGKLLRLRKKGIPTMSNPDQYGDHILYINIFLPKKINKNDEELLTKLRESESFKPAENKLKFYNGMFKKIKEFISLNK